MKPNVFLFDLDGVLVRPGGYRAAVRETVNYFSRQLGLGAMAPDDDTVAIFEAQGITCEWDMIPILIALILDEYLSLLPQVEQKEIVWPSLAEASRWLSQHVQAPLVVDFARRMRGLDQYVVVGEAPADCLLRANQDGLARPPFPFLKGQGVLTELLSHSRSLVKSKTTQLFETYALGNAVFAQSTGISPLVKTEAFLELYDVPLLAAPVRDSLLALRAEGCLGMSAYTARPSLPLTPVEDLLAVFAPEAEMALDQVGLNSIPLVGSGQMGLAAVHLGEKEDRLTKPAPYHAVAATAAAWMGDRLAALDFAEQVFAYYEKQRATRPCFPAHLPALPEHLNLHVFEDSPAGMRGAKHAAELLAGLGTQVSLHLWGVSAHSEKAAALAAVGAQVFGDVNQAVAVAVERLN